MIVVANMDEGTSPILLALIAGGFTIVGVAAKIVYDWIAARRVAQAFSLERFAAERRQSYEAFLDAVAQEQTHQEALLSQIRAVHNGKSEITEDEINAFPRSGMRDLDDSLKKIRRLARLYSVVTCAEAIVRLFSDRATALRMALQAPSSDRDELTWFLLRCFLDDRLAEFVHDYREDLGLGTPTGADRGWPVDQRARAVSLEDSERIVRAHLDTQRGKGIPLPPSGGDEESVAEN